MKIANLELIGTSHIAQESVRLIDNAFKDAPAIVALELDRQRLHALLNPGERRAGFFDMARGVGVKGAIFALLGRWAQSTLGKHVDMQPGADMLAAYHRAKDAKAQILLIDQPIEITLRRLSQELTWKEKFRMAWDVISSPFSKDEKIAIDLTKVPQKKLISTLLLKVKDRYPSIYKVLVEERNHYMAQRLSVLMARHPEERILAVIGAGHEDEMARIIKATQGMVSANWTVSVG